MKTRALWLGVCLCLSLAAWGQDSASITGTVTDPSGAAVANAQVTLSSPDRGVNRASQTNESGDYLFGSVPGGTYDLSIVRRWIQEVPGHKREAASGTKGPGRRGAAGRRGEYHGDGRRLERGHGRDPDRPISPAPSPARKSLSWN